ncbi:hypothetical protein ABIF38_002876 [Bradyrhizobium japonicum]|jgi:hypothetical protein|uniref:DUF2513 domain-containing protein n=1 Tax=Bradyrhizobium elkanii TaxID=29448 RepID=A0ABV4FEH9_BRAEL|nr:hypothetical protein [Bradyrhizobium elkanii]MBP2431551.1 hypothetical protein [Bradyrhizobium elkanii]MCP1734812.1 hypothetical protein [Bradyrhizobium elkanii]MCP1752919.1 hypothetical protein [Bradyrhizobium elkanii]MCP1975333.1 hypothetical protein [Bradyrhizobium elkanii]MCS3570151.1 hypothetical protein [Bradyrhizobium elkanii]
MTENANRSVIDEHMALVARAIAKFVSTGLSVHNIDSRGAEQFLGAPVSQEDFIAVLRWMLKENLIHSDSVNEAGRGAVLIIARAQLSAKGFAVVRQKLSTGDTIESRIQNADVGGRDWSTIGDLIGGIAGGFYKSLGSI